MTHIEVYHIEDDVPIPVRLVTSGQLKSLEVGESFVFPLLDRPKIQAYASTIKRRTGKEFIIRKQDDRYCRVWRKA